MTIDDLKDQFHQISARMIEDPRIQQIKERYDNLSPQLQSLVQILGGAIFVFILLLLPLSWHTESDESIVEFESKRNLIRDLLKVAREAQEVPNIPMPPGIDSLKSTIESLLQNANLIPDQIKSVQFAPGSSVLFPEALTAGGLEVSLWKLNLRQVVDIGHQLQAINPSVKLRDLIIRTNPQDERYFDVVYKLSSLKVPDLTAPPPMIDEDAPKKKSSSRFKSKKSAPKDDE